MKARFNEKRGTLPPKLTVTELEILQMIADGLTTPEIAARRERSYKTVARQISDILEKLKVHRQAAAVAWGFRHGRLK